MHHISLFSGIGGFELAAEWMGWQNIASCEINPFGRKVLEYYWPNSYHHDDIHTFTYEKIKDRINPNIPVCLTGGFPCQPYSLAGKRKGKEDNRHLWPEMLRVIREIKPQYVVGENVFGLISWDGGLVFDEVHTDLEREGYEVQAVVIPAAAVNAPHGRDRVWFCARLIADTNNPRTNHDIRIDRNGEEENENRKRQSQFEYRTNGNHEPTTHTDSDGQQRSDCEHEKHTGKGGEYAQHDIEQIYSNKSIIEHSNCIRQEWWMHTDKSKITIRKQFGQRNARNIGMQNWHNFPTQSPICNGNDGFPKFMDGITFSKWRNESIKAAGNAIVPQVAYEIFKAISEVDKKSVS